MSETDQTLRDWAEERGALAGALAKAQGAFGPVNKSREVNAGTYTYSYAPLDKVFEAVRKPLADNGLAITQLLDGDDLVTLLLHSSGASLSARVPLHAGGKTIQQFGSAITYLRRYALQAMLGIAAEEDDDGAAANKARIPNQRADQEAATDAARDRALGTLSTFTPEGAFDAGLIGTAEKGSGDADFELRQTADRGPRIAFRIVEGRQKLKVETFGPLAELIAQNRAAIEGQRVTCWGAMREESFTPKDSKRPVAYHVLSLARIKAGTLDLTAPEPDEEPDGLTGEEREMADLAFPVSA